MYSDPSTSGPGGRLRDADPAGPEPGKPGAAFRDALGHLGELKEYASYYFAAKVDGYKVTARNLAIYAVLGVVGAVVGVAVLASAAVALMVGLAWALGALFAWIIGPSWFWLGPLLLGLLILGGIAVGAIFGLKWYTRTSHATLVKKYEDRRRQQRNSYGHDVRQRAREEERRSAAE